MRVEHHKDGLATFVLNKVWNYMPERMVERRIERWAARAFSHTYLVGRSCRVRPCWRCFWKRVTGQMRREHREHVERVRWKAAVLEQMPMVVHPDPDPAVLALAWERGYARGVSDEPGFTNPGKNPYIEEAEREHGT